ncbi:MAG: hypothetical protein ACK5KR_02835 [Breznakia sp.]
MRKFIKRISVLSLLVIMVVTYMSPLQAAHYSEVPKHNGNHYLKNSIKYVGGGKTPFTENGVTYYNAGNIMELTISLPANTYAAAIREFVSFDLSQMQLLTSFEEIRGSLGQSFVSGGWDAEASFFNQKKSDISVSATAANYKTQSNTSGGTIGKIRFKIKDKQTTETGESININFRYQIVGPTPAGGTQYIHMGYNPNVAGSHEVSAPTISVKAHKTPTKPVAPVDPVDPILPDIDHDPSIDIDKIIDADKIEEIIEVTTDRNYSFNVLDDMLNGSNSFRNIARELIENLADKVKYQTYEFGGKYRNVEPKKTIVATSCYTHYIYVGMSFLIIFVTYGYKKYLEANRKVKWRG